MVRKTTAVEVNTPSNKQTTKTSSTPKTDDTGINIEQLLADARNGAKENSHLLIGVICLLR